MPRIPPVTRDALPPDKRSIYDAIGASRGHVSGPFPVLLNSPEVASRIATLGHYLRYESILKPMIRELAIMTVAREFDCQYAWTSHDALARQEGVREAALMALRDRKAPQGLTEEEAEIVRYVQELVRNRRVSEATFQAVLKRLGQQGITELTATMGYYAMLGCALNAFDVQPETPLLPDEA
ncbi:MAG TPA: carboxymuconolactone decarboxylase family protein [Candidatus Tectomicrobia bacterium]